MPESQLILPVNIVKEPSDAETGITFQFSVKDSFITATAPDDYTFGELDKRLLALIEPERQRYSIRVVINDDADIEGIETFQLELFVDEQPHFLLGSITRVTVTITDDDNCEDEGKEGRKGL